MAFGTVTLSDVVTVDADFEAFQASGAAIAVQLAFGESVSLVFNVDSAGTTDDVEIEILTGHRVVNGLGLDGAGSATSLNLNTVSDAIATDDDLNGTYIVMTSGGEAGEFRLITDSAAAGDAVTLDHALSGTPSAAETYARYRMGAYVVTIRCDTAISEDARHSGEVTVDWRAGEWVVARVRRNGSTNAHRVRMSYQVDGGPA